MTSTALIALSVAVATSADARTFSTPTRSLPPHATVSQYNSQAAPPVDAATKRQADAKTARAMNFFRAAQRAWAQQGSVSPNVLPCPCGGVPTSKVLPVTYYIQKTEDWCGPTSVTTIADYLGVSKYGTGYGVTDGWSPSDAPYTQQSQAAKLVLDPSAGGTDWYGTDGVPPGSWSSYYPMQDTLNFLTRAKSPNFYAVFNVPGSPTSSDVNNFEGNLVFDVNNGNGWPFAANEYAAPGYFLPNQYSSTTIKHWLAPNGYGSSGATTVYEDSGWGSGHAQSTSSTKFVVAIGSRGYIA